MRFATTAAAICNPTVVAPPQLPFITAQQVLDVTALPPAVSAVATPAVILTELALPDVNVKEFFAMASIPKRVIDHKPFEVEFMNDSGAGRSICSQ